MSSLDQSHQVTGHVHTWKPPEVQLEQNFTQKPLRKNCEKTQRFLCGIRRLLFCLRRRDARRRHAMNRNSPIAETAFAGLRCGPPWKTALFPLWYVGRGSTPYPSSSTSISSSTRSATGPARQLPPPKLQNQALLNKAAEIDLLLRPSSSFTMKA